MPNIPFAGQIPASLQEARNEFDRLLDRVWHVGLSTAPLDGQDWAPCIDVAEFPDRFEIRAELPGVAADAVDVSILDNALTIKGSKAPPPDAAPGRQAVRGECRYGRFCRTYLLPSPVRDDAVTAACRNGVLEISVPKAESARGRTVKVVSAE